MLPSAPPYHHTIRRRCNDGMGIIGFLDEGDPTTATPSHHLTAATPITSTWRSSISTSNKQKVISSDNIHDNECTESNVHERQTKNNVHHSQVKISLRYRLAAFHLFMKWLVDIFFCLNLGPFSNHYTNFYSLLRNCRRIRILVTASSYKGEGGIIVVGGGHKIKSCYGRSPRGEFMIFFTRGGSYAQNFGSIQNTQSTPC